MAYPETFAEWCELFDEFKERINDEQNLKYAYSGSFDPSVDTAEMWAEAFLAAVNERLKLAQKRFERDYSHARSDIEIQSSLSSLKRELKLIYKFMCMPCIEKIESLDGCCDIVTNAAKNIETSLLDSAKADRSGKLAVFVRNARISRFNDGGNI